MPRFILSRSSTLLSSPDERFLLKLMNCQEDIYVHLTSMITVLILVSFPFLFIPLISFLPVSFLSCCRSFVSLSVSQRDQLITLTSTLIILDITKTSTNNCLMLSTSKLHYLTCLLRHTSLADETCRPEGKYLFYNCYSNNISLGLKSPIS